MEQWKDVKGYEGLYSVSNTGQVKSHDRTGEYVRNGITVQYSERGKMLKPNLGGRYKRVCLAENSKNKHFNIHRLVAIAFIANPNNYPQVNHKDGNRFNNHVSNLEWCTASENTLHAHRTGLVDKANLGKHRIGVAPANSKLVIDLQTGIFYNSSKEAERAKGIAENTLRSYMAGARKHLNKYDLKYC